MQCEIEELREHIIVSLKGAIAILEEDIKLIETSETFVGIATVVRVIASFLHTFSQRIEKYVETCSK